MKRFRPKGLGTEDLLSFLVGENVGKSLGLDCHCVGMLLVPLIDGIQPHVPYLIFQQVLSASGMMHKPSFV